MQRNYRHMCLREGVATLVAMLISVIGCLATDSPQTGTGTGRHPSPAELQLHRDVEDLMSFATVKPQLAAYGGDTLIHLPYSMPHNGADSAGICFPDLYLVNAGLLRNGDVWLTRDNIENLLAIVGHLGFTPSCYPSADITPATLPLLSQMVREYYLATGNRDVIREAMPLLEREYDYLTEQWTAGNGLSLNRDNRDICGVELNAVMYGMERNMAYFMRELSLGGEKVWEKHATERRKTMQKLMLDPATKLYHDYNCTAGTAAVEPSSGVWAALWLGAADKAGTVVRSFPRSGVPDVYDAFFALRALDSQMLKAQADTLATYIIARETAAQEAGDGIPTGTRGALFQTAYRQLYGADASTGTPRVVNIVHVLRKAAPMADITRATAAIPSDSALLAYAAHTVDMMNEYNLPGTYLLDFDALTDTAYQRLVKQIPPDAADIGIWFGITGNQARAAGLKWDSRSDTDPRASLAMTIGYKPKEREKLVDDLMKRFKEIFGKYPLTVGGSVIDANTLAYMRKKYNVDNVVVSRERHPSEGAPCAMTGGYYQGAYYPSKKNILMPAQTAGGAIGMVAFRYPAIDPLSFMRTTADGTPPPVVTFEPASPEGGADPLWTRRALHNMLYAPAYGEVRLILGQETAATTDGASTGLRYQLPTLARLSRKGDLRIQTIATSGQAFRSKNSMTPATAFTASFPRRPGMDTDTPTPGVLWFSSRTYRIALQWDDGTLRVRDLHIFDENVEEPWANDPCTTRETGYRTLPLIDADNWSSRDIGAGMKFYTVDTSGTSTPMRFGRPHTAKGDGTFAIIIPVITDDGAYVEGTTSFTRRGKKGISPSNICRIDDIPYEQRAPQQMRHTVEMVITLTDNTVDFTLRPAPRAQTTLPDWFAAIEHAPDAEVPFAGHYLTYTPGMPPATNMAEAVSDGVTYRLTLDNGSVFNTATRPRTSSGAVTAMTFVPDMNSISLRF